MRIMFWVDKIQDAIKLDLKEKIASGEPLIIRDEKTASGRIHVGSMRGVAIHGLISEVLNESGIQNKFLYEINDFDVMDGLPAYLDEKIYKPYMGKLLLSAPSPDGKAKNFAEYFANEFKEVIDEAGFYPEFYQSSELYLSGRMNDVIRKALEEADTIRKIYKKVSGSEQKDNWLPISVICEGCGKIGTTTTTEFDGEKVTYTCEPKKVEWAEGCGHEGKISPFDGNAKLPWKVEWAAKFVVLGVHIEGAGKDHSTKGGARDVANNIAKEVYGIKSPFDIPYEFFLVGGKKMSSSKGAGSSARAISSLLPPHIFRLALIGKDPKRTVEFEPDGNTIPTLFDTYDRIAEKYFTDVNDDEARLFTLVHKPEDRKKLEQSFLPRFSLIAFLVQMPHMQVVDEVAKVKGSALSEAEIKVVEERMYYASKWLTEYASDLYKFELQESVPEITKEFSEGQKNALQKVLHYVEQNDELGGESFHTRLHEIRKEEDLEAKVFFSSIYQSFLGKDSGPKVGWFLSVLDRDFLIQRLTEVTA